MQVITHLGLLFSAGAGLLAQSPPAAVTAEQVAEGRQVFVQSCAGCHGEDTYGTDRAPGLSGNRRVRARTADQIRNLVLHGIPSAGHACLRLAGAKVGFDCRLCPLVKLGRL